MEQVTLQDKSYDVVKVKLRKWLDLEAIKIQIEKAVDVKDKGGLSSLICQYVSTAFSVSIDPNIPWRELASAFLAIIEANLLTINIGFLKSKYEERHKEPWEYDGRLWWVWAHTFAKEFGWSLEYIAEMNVDEAIYLFQEVLVNQQLDREWAWMLSDNSIGYNDKTKKSEFHPLPRPDWMRSPIEPPKKIRIPMELIPVGNVIKWGEKGAASVIH